MQKANILLLEDDVNLSDTIKEYLEDEGYIVEVAYNSDEAYEKIYEKNFDILLLDVMVPGENGFEILKKIRQKSKTPAIFITSLNSVDDLEKGYNSGCDDYIRKPFVLKELKLRIETLLKREFDTKNRKIKIDENFEYDLENDELLKDNKTIPLNNKEKKLLKLFLKNKNQILTHESIYENLWDYDETPSDSSLRTYIKNLRKILGKEKIVSIKKHGYKFVTK
ncbi:response regulator transcription factor [Nitrosophilus kaiyonis]|uniref:response regulator transcription factor n=1 Tax=Nitrosophilus kaiyonis TaxID=2930200 RepID=UPI002490FC15|nr:response regulator transcription factor [Nitrosophilus kaiyonis]